MIDAIRSQAGQLALDPLVASTDVFMTSVCWVGSKSLSHVLACIDRTKGRLLEDGSASDAARTQIISSVMEYWSAHPGVAISIVEKLLNYSILTPFSVVDWALIANSPVNATNGGDSLGQPHIFELAINTITKVTRRARQVLTAADAGNEERERDTRGMRELFQAANDALSSWAAGSKDEMMEDGDGAGSRDAMVRRWGQRWLRVFQRLSAIEEAFVLDVSKKTAKGAADEMEAS